MTSQEPKNPQGPAGPLQSNRIPQDSLDPCTPRIIRTPQDPFRTASGTLNTPSVILGPLRTLQDLSEPFRVEPLGISYYDLLKDNILYRKMLVFNLHIFHSLTNILGYFASWNKIRTA